MDAMIELQQLTAAASPWRLRTSARWRPCWPRTARPSRLRKPAGSTSAASRRTRSATSPPTTGSASTAWALLPAGLDSVLQFLPSSAAAAFTTVTGAGDSVLGATAGALVLAAWVAAALGASVLTITRRDV
jgi:hypothetical protein